MMRANLRGELTLYKDEEMQQFSVRDNELIDAVASHFKVGSTEVRKHSQSKVLSCDSNTTQPLHRFFLTCEYSCLSFLRPFGAVVFTG